MASLGDTVAALAAHRRAPSAAAVSQTELAEVLAFGDNPGGLRMLVHAPAGRHPRAPLVVVLHGCTQTASAYAHGAGWRELAERCGFVLLCPEQTRGNNPNLCFNWFHPADTRRGQGEAASIHAMVRRAVTDYDLDPQRVFITGLSAGGAMANVMLAAYPESFAGGAIIAGLPYGVASNMQEAFSAMHGGRPVSPERPGAAVRAASSHSGPWPRVSVWQGDADKTVAPRVADDLVRQWRDVHGVAAEVVEQRTAGERRHTVWRDGHGQVAVELHQLGGMGHGTPLGSALADGCGTGGPYLLEVGVSSTLESAQAWGLVQPDHERRTARSSSPPPTRPRAHAAAPAPALRVVTSEIGAAITDALRSAGLLR